MAQKITVQDGKVLYVSSDPVTVGMDFTVLGVIKAGNTLEAAGLITTPPNIGIDLILKTNTDGVTASGNIRLTPGGNGKIVLKNVAWPDGSVQPVPGMYLGVSAVNTLQFLTLPPNNIQVRYQIQTSTAGQTVFNTTVPTAANNSGLAHLLVFVNGVKKIEGVTQNYTVTGLNQITFSVALNLNDSVEFYAV